MDRPIEFFGKWKNTCDSVDNKMNVQSSMVKTYDVTVLSYQFMYALELLSVCQAQMFVFNMVLNKTVGQIVSLQIKSKVIAHQYFVTYSPSIAKNYLSLTLRPR